VDFVLAGVSWPDASTSLTQEGKSVVCSSGLAHRHASRLRVPVCVTFWGSLKSKGNSVYEKVLLKICDLGNDLKKQPFTSREGKWQFTYLGSEQ
jgi:hypothetical protein